MRAALRAITLTPAEICGISSRVGSIEPGKDADFSLFPCDPLTIAAKPGAGGRRRRDFISGMKEEAPRQDLFEKIGLAPLEGVGMAVRKEWVILMREMDVSEVTNAVRELCVAANKRLPEDLTQCISSCAGCEEQALPQGIMQDLLDNLDAARELDIPVCQDTGMAVVFAEVGQEVHFTGGDFEAAVQEACAGLYGRAAALLCGGRPTGAHQHGR